jgi:hypothetical protein
MHAGCCLYEWSIGVEFVSKWTVVGSWLSGACPFREGRRVSASTTNLTPLSLGIISQWN